jgi:predicted adenylyl cyclase CyaB
MKPQFRAQETDDDLDSVATTAQALPAMVAVITGGDPLTRPERARRLIEKLGPDKALVLDTSGVGDIEPLIAVLKQYCVHVRVSLDAISDLNKKLRPTNREYVTTREPSSVGAQRTIERCVREGIPVSVQTVVTSLNDKLDEWFDLRDWLISRKVRNWVLHVVVKGGSARRIEERSEGKRSGGISPNRQVYARLWRLVEDTIKLKLPIDVRCTDTDTTPNSVLLVGSKGDLYTEGYAHKGKVLLYRVGDARPDLMQALWPHVDRFGHARRYLNWNPWFFPGKSLNQICYDIQVPDLKVEESARNPVETEAKFVVADEKGLRIALKREGFVPDGKAKLQRDEYFDTTELFAKRMDYVVRLRSEDRALAVALKGPRHYIGSTSSRIELEFPAGEEGKVRAALRGKGFGITWFFEKRRTTFTKKGMNISVALDEVPDIGHFVELEGPISAVEQLQKRLENCLGPQQKENYADLYRAHMLERGVPNEKIAGASFSKHIDPRT